MNNPGRIMALDVGDVRTGVAMTDPLQMIASPHSVVQQPSLEGALRELKRIIQESEPVLIVVGIPLDQEGKQGRQANKVMAFVEKLRAETSVEIVTQDERFTTTAAERMLISADVSRKKRKQVVDKIAATNILRSYMDRRASQIRIQENSERAAGAGNDD
jgi:putative holliday junction resolvase